LGGEADLQGSPAKARSPPNAEVQMRGNTQLSAVRRRAFGAAQVRKIVADTNGGGMLGAERLLADR